MEIEKGTKIMGKRTTHKTAFTLIELLVVVAIISLLVSILVPSLKKAKELAVQVSCQSKFRNIGQVSHMYANDNGGKFPTILSGSGSLGIFPLLHAYHPFYFNPERPYDPDPRWVCPVSLARNEPGLPHGRPFAINAGLVYGRRSTHPYDGMWGGFCREVKIDDVPNIAGLIWMTEAADMQWESADLYMNYNWRPFCFGEWGMAPWPTIEFYHMDTYANAVFLDGHVEGLPQEASFDFDIWLLHE